MNKIVLLSRPTTVVIATVIADMLRNCTAFEGVEERLVVEAIRRSSNKLSDASYDEIAKHISGMSDESLRGFGNNVKGIYHELLFAHTENNDGDEISATLFEATNHPGADVMLVHEDGAVFEVQLKATDNTDILSAHFEKYPEIPVFATEEVASKFTQVMSSGASNLQLDADVYTKLEKIEGDSAIGNLDHNAAISGIASAAIQARAVLSGETKVKDAGKRTLQDIGVAVSATLIIDLMFS